MFSFGVRDSMAGKAEKKQQEMRDENKDRKKDLVFILKSSWKQQKQKEQNRKFLPLMSVIYAARCESETLQGSENI